MKASLQAGITYQHTFRVTRAKTVPALYPESPDFQVMPEVFATGFLVGFLEWACLLAIKPHLDEGEGSVGTRIDVTHEAATPPGFEVTAKVELVAVEGRKLSFRVGSHDGVDLISKGTHERFVIHSGKFAAKLAATKGTPPA